jgi:hypothetical protein
VRGKESAQGGVDEAQGVTPVREEKRAVEFAHPQLTASGEA